MHRYIDMIAHTTAFVIPVVVHWLELEITFLDICQLYINSIELTNQPHEQLTCWDNIFQTVGA